MTNLRDNSTRSKNAYLMMKIITFYYVFSILVYVYTLYISNKGLDMTLTYEELEQFNIVIIAEALIGFILLIINAIFFIQWFRRAYFNLHLFRKNLNHSEGMAAGAWFIPIFNLYAPYGIANEMVDQTRKELGTDSTNEQSYTGYWWTFWILSSIISIIGRISSGETDNFENLTTSTYFNILSGICIIMAGIFVLKYIRYYSHLEEKLKNLKNADQGFQMSNNDLLDS